MATHLLPVHRIFCCAPVPRLLVWWLLVTRQALEESMIGSQRTAQLMEFAT